MKFKPEKIRIHYFQIAGSSMVMVNNFLFSLIGSQVCCLLQGFSKMVVFEFELKTWQLNN